MSFFKNFFALNLKSLINILSGFLAIFIIGRFYGQSTLELVVLSNAIIGFYIIVNNIIIDVGIKQILQQDLEVNISNIFIFMLKNSLVFFIFNLLVAYSYNIDILFFMTYFFGYILFSISSIFRIKSFILNNFLRESLYVILYKIQYIFILVILYFLNLKKIGVALGFLLSGLTYFFLMFRYAYSEFKKNNLSTNVCKNVDIIFFLRKSSWMILVYLGVYFSNALVVLIIINKNTPEISSIVIMAMVIGTITSQLIGNINDIYVKKIFENMISSKKIFKIYLLEIIIVLILSVFAWKLSFIINMLMKLDLNEKYVYLLPYFIILFSLFSTNSLITNSMLSRGFLKKYGIITMCEGVFISCGIFLLNNYTILIPIYVFLNICKISYFLRSKVNES